MVLEQLDIHVQKNKNGPLSYHIQKITQNELQNYDLNVIAPTTELLEDNRSKSLRLCD